MNTRYSLGAFALLLLLLGCDLTATQSMLDGSPLDVLDAEGDASGGVDAPADRRAVQDRPDADAPVPPLPAVYATENVPLRRIFAAYGHTFATALDGSFWGWGDNSAGMMQPAEYAHMLFDRRLRPQRIDGIRDAREGGGDCYLAGPDGAGSVYCWGRGAWITYGVPGDTWVHWRTPRRMGTFDDVRGFFWNSFCVRADRTIWEHRRNDDLWESSVSFQGQVLPSPTRGVYHLVDGVEATSYAHIAHYFEPGRHRIPGIVQVAGDDEHMCMLLNTGRVMCWGSNTAGQSGNFDLGGRCGADGRGPGDCVRRPTEVPGIDDVVQIAANIFTTCALKRDGTVWCWGINGPPGAAQGYIGDGQPVGDEICGFSIDAWVPCRRRPTRIAGISRAVQISVGLGHKCAVLADGQALCWGGNENGELGDGTTTDHYLPTPVRWF